jgi:pyruvate dehydrogenase E2 component (dihydrolipoamide acetyltransferase)
VAREIVMPRLSDSMEEGTVVRWLVAPGDHVQEGRPLVEVETDKATVIYESDRAGVILALSVAEGASVPVGAPIAVIGEAGEQLPGQGSSEAVAALHGVQQAGTGAHDETPAVAMQAAPPTSAPRSSAPLPPSATPHGGGRGVRQKASPLARRIAAQLNVGLGTLAGSGPQGRVIRADVERAAAAANGSASPAQASPAQASPAQASPAQGSPAQGSPAQASPAQGDRDETAGSKGEAARRELTRLQATVARRMAQSRATVPDIELRREVDMGEAVALRERLRELSDDVPSYNDLVVKAVALALRELPRVNGAYRDGQFESYTRVNVGIAVAGEETLVVPTIFDADTKSLGEIGRTARALAQRVRDGSIAPDDLAGATFTVSNLGMYGVDSFSAVINPPQAAILAVGSLRRRPIVDESGALVARPTVVLTLACDHRILYGVDGARFLARVSELLERPLSLLM